MYMYMYLVTNTQSLSALIHVLIPCTLVLQPNTAVVSNNSCGYKLMVVCAITTLQILLLYANT